jgi:TolB-like protein/Tfp pilus assembly protein PilF
MSPEQMMGQTVDARADLWALGVMLYEMATGQAPFAGDNLPAVAYAVRHKEPPSPAGIRSEVPADLERVLDRTLAKDPQQRYQTADELVGDLEAVRDEQDLARKTARYDRRQSLKRRKRLLIGTFITFLVAAVALVWWNRHLDLNRIDALAVLPFVNLSGLQDQEFFADGMTDALITQLHELAGDQVRVIGRTSVMTFKNSDKTLPQIAAELGVDAVVEASVVRSGDQVRIDAKLIRARPQEQQLWAQTFQRNQRDVLSLHADIAQAVAEQIQLILTPSASGRLEQANNAVVDPQAYEAYLKGRHYLLNIRLDGIRLDDPQSLEEFDLIGKFFTKSVEIDSTYAPAWAGLAEFHIQREHEGIGTDAIAQAQAAVEKALELDEHLGAAHSAMGHLLWDHLFKAREAGPWIQRALELSPNDPYIQTTQAYYCMTMGRFEDSVRAMRKAQEIDPLSRFINQASWMPLTYAGRYEEALLGIEKLHETFPDIKNWRLSQVAVYRHWGRHEEAITVLQAALQEVDPGAPAEVAEAPHMLIPCHMAALGRMQEARDYLGRHQDRAENLSMFRYLCRAYACIGELDEATKWLDEYEKVTPAKEIGLNFAVLAVSCGDIDRAFRYLENAYENRIFFLNRLALVVEAREDLKPLAEDPRYHEMVRRIGIRD